MVAAVKDLGGVSAIAISHPHFYGSMIEWAHAFDAPVYIHAKDREWVARPDDSVVFWDGDTREIGDGLTLINAGVHFDGGQVLHRAGGEDSRGALFSGDIFTVVQDRRWVSFMYSYPNLIPERPRTIRRALSLVEPFGFDQVYGGWWRRITRHRRRGGGAEVGGTVLQVRPGRHSAITQNPPPAPATIGPSGHGPPAERSRR